MATTTNYSWETPDDTDLVKDGAAAIRTLGSSIDTTTKALNPSTTLGDIEYRSATANTNTRLGVGSTGNVLTVAGGVPTWAAPAGGGKVLQVVNASTSTLVAITTSSYTDTGLTATITPTLATSKILVLITQFINVERSNVRAYAGWQYLRGATVLTTRDILFGLYTGGGVSAMQGFVNASYLDSPATTSATTYKTQGIAYDTTNGGVSNFNQGFVSTITLLEIGE